MAAAGCGSSSTYPIFQSGQIGAFKSRRPNFFFCVDSNNPSHQKSILAMQMQIDSTTPPLPNLLPATWPAIEKTIRELGLPAPKILTSATRFTRARSRRSKVLYFKDPLTGRIRRVPTTTGELRRWQRQLQQTTHRRRAITSRRIQALLGQQATRRETFYARELLPKGRHRWLYDGSRGRYENMKPK